MKAVRKTLPANASLAPGAGLAVAGAVVTATRDRGAGLGVAGATTETATLDRGAGRAVAIGRKLVFPRDSERSRVPLH